MTFNTTAIILKRRDFREADLEITYLSKDYGKMRAVATGAKKIISKLASHLEPWREVRLMVVDGKYFDKIGQVKVLNNFNIHKDLNVQTVLQAQKASQIVDKIFAVRQNEIGLYRLVKNFFERNFSAKSSENLLPIFGWKLTDLAGFSPQVKKCLNCNRTIKIEINYFDFLNGGLICKNCIAPFQKQSQRISAPVTGWLKAIKHYPFEELISQEMSKKTIKELNNFLEIFLKFHL